MYINSDTVHFPGLCTGLFQGRGTYPILADFGCCLGDGELQYYEKKIGQNLFFRGGGLLPPPSAWVCHLSLTVRKLLLVILKIIKRKMDIVSLAYIHITSLYA